MSKIAVACYILSGLAVVVAAAYMELRSTQQVDSSTQPKLSPGAKLVSIPIFYFLAYWWFTSGVESLVAGRVSLGGRYGTGVYFHSDELMFWLSVLFSWLGGVVIASGATTSLLELRHHDA